MDRVRKLAQEEGDQADDEDEDWDSEDEDVVRKVTVVMRPGQLAPAPVAVTDTVKAQ